MERINMKAKDLMIGDWVLAEGKPLQVTNVSCLGGDIIHVMNPIMSYDIAYASNIIALSNGAKDINKIEPITLTPEILEKNGYTCKRSLDKEIISYNWTSPDRRVTLNDQNGSPWFCIIRSEGMMEEVMIGITYVHELQHALKLCKIEKEIVL